MSDQGFDWGQPHTSQVGDFEANLAAAMNAIRSQSPQPTMLVTNPATKQAYVAFLERQCRYKTELELLSRRRLVRGYRLRRLLGHSRLAILWPWAHTWRMRARWAWLDFKHRNDPDWL